MEGLDIVAFCTRPEAYRALAHWAALNRHRLLLLVTEPAAGDRGDRAATGLAAVLPPAQDVLATRRMRTTVAPVLAALKPDLVVSAAYPRPIPAEVAGTARLGAIDLLASLPPLPSPRGSTHASGPCLVATVRRAAPGPEAGPLLATRERRLPEATAPEHIRAAWGQVVAAALDDAVARAAVDAERRPARGRPATPPRRSAPPDGAAHPAGTVGGDEVVVLDARSWRGAGSAGSPGGDPERAEPISAHPPDRAFELAVAR